MACSRSSALCCWPWGGPDMDRPRSTPPPSPTCAHLRPSPLETRRSPWRAGSPERNPTDHPIPFPGESEIEPIQVAHSALLKLRRASMKKRVSLLATAGVLVALAAFLTTQLLSAGESGTALQEKAAPAKAPAEPRETKRADDEAAVRKATADFIKVVEKGDAKAVAASWTEDGEYIDDDGTTIRGRAA